MLVKKCKYVSTDVWINKMQYTHTMGYYLATKRNEEWIHGCTLKTLG